MNLEFRFWWTQHVDMKCASKAHHIYISINGKEKYVNWNKANEKISGLDPVVRKYVYRIFGWNCVYLLTISTHKALLLLPNGIFFAEGNNFSLLFELSCQFHACQMKIPHDDLHFFYHIKSFSWAFVNIMQINKMTKNEEEVLRKKKQS